MMVPTYTATIYVGTRRGYDGEIKPYEEVAKIIQDWVDSVGMCVTVTPTEYIYTGGREPGIIVGFINYPRFPEAPRNIELKVLDLAQILLRECKQMGLSIVFPDRTLMLSNTEEVELYQLKKKES